MSSLAEIHPASPGEHEGFVLVPRLASIARSGRQLMQLKLAHLGVLVGQDHLLSVLDDREPTSVLGLAQRLNVRPSTVSKMVDQLSKNGWAVRETTDEDRRVTHVRLTAAGVEIREHVRAIWARLDDELSGALAPEAPEVDTVRTLERMAEVLKARLFRLR